MKDGTLHRNNAGFPIGIGAPYYMEMLSFSALITHIEKKKKIQSVRFHLPKTSSLYIWNPKSKRFVNPPGYAFEFLPEAK